MIKELEMPKQKRKQRTKKVARLYLYTDAKG